MRFFFVAALAALVGLASAVRPSDLARDLAQLQSAIAVSEHAQSSDCASTEAAILAVSPTTSAEADKMISCAQAFYLRNDDRRAVFLTAYKAVTAAIRAQGDFKVRH